MNLKNTIERFGLEERVAVITGGAGLLGEKHAEAVMDAGGTAVLWDINGKVLEERRQSLAERYKALVDTFTVDITDPDSIRKGFSYVLEKFQRIDILINNAANDPKVEPGEKLNWGRLENLSLQRWEAEVSVGLTGAFLCSQIIGTRMARNGGGVILNIASDLGIIAPDQRIYEQPGLAADEQPVKPVTYSVIKHGIIGLTKYLATYWAEKNVRVNAISPGGVYNRQPDTFVHKLTHLIPLGRMAEMDEYKAAVLFLISDASSYMTGSNLIVDGGRTCW